VKIDYRKKFLKELAKIHIGERLKIENFVFKELPKANSIFCINLSTKNNPENPVDLACPVSSSYRTGVIYKD